MMRPEITQLLTNAQSVIDLATIAELARKLNTAKLAVLRNTAQYRVLIFSTVLCAKKSDIIGGLVLSAPRFDSFTSS